MIVGLSFQNGVSPNFQFEDNLGPLHLAAKNGNTQCAFYLLQFNANPNMVSKVSKKRSLQQWKWKV